MKRDEIMDKRIRRLEDLGFVNSWAASSMYPGFIHPHLVNGEPTKDYDVARIELLEKKHNLPPIKWH